jgi:hypothetical protein
VFTLLEQLYKENHPHGLELSDMSDHTSILSPGQRRSTSVDQVTWIIHEGGFLFIIYHNCQESSPIRWIMSWNAHGISDIFITYGDFASRSTHFLAVYSKCQTLYSTITCTSMLHVQCSPHQLKKGATPFFPAEKAVSTPLLNGSCPSFFENQNETPYAIKMHPTSGLPLATLHARHG